MELRFIYKPIYGLYYKPFLRNSPQIAIDSVTVTGVTVTDGACIIIQEKGMRYNIKVERGISESGIRESGITE